MRYYSTKQHSVDITLRNALIDCYAPDGGQYLPAGLPVVPRAFINNMSEMSLKETAFVICNMLFGDDIASARLKAIADEALSFDMPLISAGRDRYMIELFHGPTLAFKDISARFMAGLTKELYHDEAKSRLPPEYAPATSRSQISRASRPALSAALISSPDMAS